MLLRTTKSGKVPDMIGSAGSVDPIRVEQKLVHGKMVNVKVYAMKFTPSECYSVEMAAKRKKSTLEDVFGTSLSSVFSSGTEF